MNIMNNINEYQHHYIHKIHFLNILYRIRCGRVIIQIARDYERTRQQIKSSFTAQIETLCIEAKRISKNLPIDEEPSLESPRIQILKRLCYLCTVIENMAIEGRRQTNEFFKDLIDESMIEHLVNAFPCTLPPSRQLFAQLRYLTNTSMKKEEK